MGVFIPGSVGRWAGWCAVLGLGATFLGAYTAKYVPSHTAWWLQVLALGLPYLAVPVVGVGLIVLTTGRWGLAAFYVPLLILVAIRFGPRWPAEEGQSELRVMTYNAGSRGVGHTPSSFRTLLEVEHPDILALQEVGVQYLEATGFLAIQAGFGGALTDGTYESQPPTDSPPEPEAASEKSAAMMQPVFVRSNAVSISRIERIMETNQRSVVRAEVEWNSRRIAVYNVHLHSFDGLRPWREQSDDGSSLQRWLRVWREALRAYREDFVERDGEARRLRERLDEETLPYIVCGDFNGTRHQWAYGHLARGLQDALVQGGAWKRATFPARRPVVGIDHVLVSPTWRVLGARVVAEDRSDHRPVVVRLRLEGVE